MLALTNHAVVRIAAVKCGIHNFTDYLVLGDDIVIANERVAVEYRRLIVGMGVSISEHKSILPSALAGAEFASKLMTNEANYSPLPTLLLSKGDLTSKVQFLTEVVNRVVTEIPQSHPSLDLMCQAVFGKRLAHPLGDLFCRYYLFKQFTATRKGVTDLREGILPERIATIYNNESLLTQFDFLLTILESTKLEDYGVTLTKLNHLVVKELEKATKLVMKLSLIHI